MVYKVGVDALITWEIPHFCGGLHHVLVLSMRSSINDGIFIFHVGETFGFDCIKLDVAQSIGIMNLSDKYALCFPKKKRISICNFS